MTDIDDIRKLFVRGKVSRRQFMQYATAAGLTASTAAALLAQPSHASTPKKGGHFRLGMADFATTDSLDPRVFDTKMQQNLNWQLRNCLIEAGPGASLIPELAESWEGSDNARKWVFKLRRGVEFHNGKSFEAADVIYSINIHRSEDTKSSVKPFFKSVKSITATDTHEVTIELENGNQDFPAILSMHNLSIVPDGATDFSDGVGTGGYVLESFNPGVSSIVKRAPNYWKSDAAHFDSIEITAIGDSTARQTALISNSIDAFNFVEPKTASYLERASNVKLVQVAGKSHYMFACRTDTDPYTNNDVRLALKYGIDRESILGRILNGYGTIGNDQPLSAAYPFYNPDIPQHQYDPDKARFHAKKGGIDQMTLQLHTAETPFAGATDTGILYSEHLKKAGVDLKVVRGPNDGFWSDVWAKKPFFASRWSGRPTEDIMLETAYSAGALQTGWNETYYDNERLNNLLEWARVESDTAKRREMYGEAQLIIHDTGGAIIPVFADYLDAVSVKIGHKELSSYSDLDGGRAGERWWFV